MPFCVWSQSCQVLLGQTVLGREYHVLIPSSLGVTPGLVSQKPHLKKSTGGGPMEQAAAGAGPHPLTTELSARQSWTESITR